MVKRVAACTACALWKTCRTVCISSDGPTDADIVFVGEAPGAEEDVKGKPFVGASGVMLRDRIEEYLPEYSVRISSAVRCRPPGNRTPTPQEVQKCAELHLFPELRKKPKLIVAVGLSSVRVLTGVKGILKYAGQVLPSDYGPVFVLPHPEYVLRNKSYASTWEGIWRRMPKMVDPPDETNLEYRLLTSEEDVRSLLSLWTREKRVVAFDYETDYISPWDGDVKSVAVSAFPGEAFCFDPRRYDSAWKDWLAGSSRKVAHNYAFEGIWSQVRFGVQPANVEWDTKLAMKLIDENRPSGLKELAIEMTDLGDYAREEKASVKSEEWKYLTINDVWKYNCFDADATLRIYKQQRENMSSKDRDLLAVSLCHVQALNRARERGIAVDTSAFSVVESALEEEERKAKEQMRTHAVVRAFEKIQGKELNVNSPNQVRELLTGYLNIRPTAFSYKTGLAKMDKNFLEKVRDQHPAVDLLVQARKAFKARTTTLKHLKAFTHKGKVHTQWNVGQADTWRISSSNPPMQNNSKIPQIRNLFVAERGYVLVEMDYSQIELRVMASLSGEEAFLSAYHQGKDVHARTASEIFKVPLADVTKEQRSKGKSVNFGVLYGITPKGMYEKFGIPEKQGAEMLNAYWSAYPAIRKWVRARQDEACKRGYVESAYGRRRRFPSGTTRRDRHAMNQAANFPIQSTAAEMCLNALALIEAMHPGYLIGQVHDSVLFHVPEDEVEDMVPVFRRIMEAQGKSFMLCPVVVDTKVGPRWGEMEKRDGEESRNTKDRDTDRGDVSSGGDPEPGEV